MPYKKVRRGRSSPYKSYDYRGDWDVDYYSLPSAIDRSSENIASSSTPPPSTTATTTTTTRVYPTRAARSTSTWIPTTTTQKYWVNTSTTSRYPPSCGKFEHLEAYSFNPRQLLACLTAIAAMGNVQSNRHLTAQVANQIEKAIDQSHASSGFHFFEVNGSPALGHGLAIVFVVILITLLMCCFARCKKATIKHLSVRNAVRTITEQATPYIAPCIPRVSNPFQYGPCGRHSAPTLPIVVPAPHTSMPISPASAPLILHTTAAPAPPAYDLAPIGQSKAYSSPLSNSGVPYGV